MTPEPDGHRGRNELAKERVTQEAKGILGKKAGRAKNQGINLDNQSIKLDKGAITENREQRKSNWIS